MDDRADALELLLAQHAEIDALLVEIAAATSPGLRGAAVSELADKLTLHLAIEQELFYPAVARSVGDDVARELLAEHVEIKRLLAEVLWLEADDPQFGPTLAALRAVLDWHELWQERPLFEAVAKLLAADTLQTLGAELDAWIARTARAATMG